MKFAMFFMAEYANMNHRCMPGDAPVFWRMAWAGVWATNSSGAAAGVLVCGQSFVFIFIYIWVRGTCRVSVMTS